MADSRQTTESRPLWTTAWALWKMARPAQLLLIGAVYSLGTATAVARSGEVPPLRLSVGLAALLPVAVSVHYANEFADYETDLLTTRTPFSGGSGALARTGLSRRLPLLAAGVSLAAGILGAVGLWAVGWFSGPAFALLGTIALFGWQYSVGPFTLVRRGLGELDNALLGGLVLPCYGFAVATGDVTLQAAVFFLPFTVLVFLNLLATTWPDRWADGAVGKRTLAVRWPRSRLRATYVLGVAAWAGSLVVAPLPTPVLAGSLLAVPLVVWSGVTYTRKRSPFPAVAAMVLTAIGQLVGWLVVSLG